jgi:hypothetical protein
LFPILLAKVFAIFSGGEMANENTGGGAALWLYLIIYPASVVAFIILVIQKIKNYNDTK